MPKLYEYFGLIIMFYANEHYPVHVHGKCQGREMSADIILLDGIITEINFRNVTGREPLDVSEQRLFKEVVSGYAEDIVQKWIDFFVLHKHIKSERITRRVK